MLHHCALNGLEEAGEYLAENKCDLNVVNDKGETALHLAARGGKVKLVEKLLQLGANPNFQTILHGEESELFLESPLHVAIMSKETEVTNVLIDWKNETQRREEMKTNFDLKNSLNQTPLSLALSLGLQDISNSLIRAGANVNELNEETGQSLLHTAIYNNDTDNALFLMDNGADIEHQ